MRFTTHFGLHFQAIRLQGGSYYKSHYPHRSCTFCGLWPQSRELRVYNNCRKALLHTTFPIGKTKGFSAGLFLVHSPLLKESLLVSFPPPSYMLKFSGYSQLIQGQSFDVDVCTPSLHLAKQRWGIHMLPHLNSSKTGKHVFCSPIQYCS
jgi:hypothetical protein